MIKKFKEWLDERLKSTIIPARMGYGDDLLEEAYEAGVKAASDHYEEDAMAIHESYINAYRKVDNPRGLKGNYE